MKNKILILGLGIIIIVGVYLILSRRGIFQDMQIQKEVVMEVKFYTLNPETRKKDEFLGTAKLKNGELIIDVSDPKLEELLKKPQTVRKAKSGEKMIFDYALLIQPGSVEHLKAFVQNCYKYGYIAEIVE